MANGDGRLPGTGFDLSDPVEVLGADGPIMDKLRGPDGSWRLAPARRLVVPEGYKPGKVTYVVIDTGVCDDHPSLVGRVIEQIDLTGEGARDENGHGTAVASILACDLPWSEIIGVKALNRQGQSSIELLSHALRRAESLLVGREGVGLINVSAGRRTPSCINDCPLCVTVRDIWDSSRLLTVAAAGNDPGITFCPARSAISVATPDQWSATGDVTVLPPTWVELA